MDTLSFSGIIGASHEMKQVVSLISQAAPSRSTILVVGESGTGKELVAHAIHDNSPRAKKPFVAVSCAALPETLIESELFGHEPGAFTGAQKQKKGRFELADGGTLFMDEIGELSLPIQVKLLRVLQEREFERLGDTKPLKVDVRLVAATNRDLNLAVQNGTFREDLFFRLNVIRIELPPLRQRKEDLPALAEHFVARHARHNSKTITGLTHEALVALTDYDWPGNVRELENVIERAVVLSNGDCIGLDLIPDYVRASGETRVPASGAVAHPVENIVAHLPHFSRMPLDARQAAVALAVHLASEIDRQGGGTTGSRTLFIPRKTKQRGGGGGLSAHEGWHGLSVLAYALAGVVLWDLRHNRAIEDPAVKDLETYTTGFTRGRPTPLLARVRSLVVPPPVSPGLLHSVDVSR